MHKSIIERDERSTFLAGSEGPSSLSAASAGTVVPFPFPQAATAALVGFEDEASSFDDPVSIGELAVRIVARWSLPRCTVFVRGSESWEE